MLTYLVNSLYYINVTVLVLVFLYVNNVCTFTQDEKILKRLRGHAGLSKPSIHSESTTTKAFGPRSYNIFRAPSVFYI